MHKTAEELEEIKPEIETDLFRKYISYARRNIHPVLTEEAAEKLKEFYVSLRATSTGGTAAATPRQLEALVRLAEASAKIRLKTAVTVSDAERAINLTDFVLKAIAYDERTGQFDIDRVVSAYPKSTRDRIRTIEEIIRTLVAESPEKTASRDEVLTKASEQGIDRTQTEHLIQELRKKGEIYEPRSGKYKLTEE
jgi:replicative DNA helicase Mcm